MICCSSAPNFLKHSLSMFHFEVNKNTCAECSWAWPFVHFPLRHKNVSHRNVLLRHKKVSPRNNKIVCKMFAGMVARAYGLARGGRCSQKCCGHFPRPGSGEEVEHPGAGNMREQIRGHFLRPGNESVCDACKRGGHGALRFTHS